MPMQFPSRRRLTTYVVLGVVCVVLVIVARATYFVSRNIFDLLRENQKLRSAIANLTKEDTIGYAKVLDQPTRDGSVFTRLVFVETDRDDPTKHVLHKEYEIEGDVVHFDALVVKFGDQLVADGKERALYLWRRIYGEKMKPEDGLAIEAPGQPSPRYEAVFKKLPLRDRTLFWSEIWRLADNRERLQEAGVRAIFGSVTYRELRPGFVYVFKIGNAGSIFVESVPDLTSPQP
jgi:hypothetical protein